MEEIPEYLFVFMNGFVLPDKRLGSLQHQLGVKLRPLFITDTHNYSISCQLFFEVTVLTSVSQTVQGSDELPS